MTDIKRNLLVTSIIGLSFCVTAMEQVKKKEYLSDAQVVACSKLSLR